MKIKGLLFENIDEIFDSTVLNLKKKLNLSDEEFQAKLSEKLEEITDIYEETVISLHHKNYLIPYKGFLKNTFRTAKIISSQFEESFHLYFSYINTCFVVLERIKQNCEDPLEAKDSVTLSLYGYLYRIADQIGLMLLNGYPDGALRLWRSFYDHAVILLLLMRENSNELANKFIDHSLRHSQNKATSLNKHAEELQFDKVEDDILNNYKTIAEEFEDKYGKDFLKKEYSWTKDIFKKERVSFRDIEDDLGMSRYRPFYIWASSYSHCSFESMHDFENNKREIVIDDITQQITDTDAYIDPIQITIAVFHDVNSLFLQLYSIDSEYWINVRLFEKFQHNLHDSLDD